MRFSPHLPGCLTTCGTGHIRFWRAADTFTGLKLQVGSGFRPQWMRSDAIGMFDMSACVTLPDGKGLCGLTLVLTNKDALDKLAQLFDISAFVELSILLPTTLNLNITAESHRAAFATCAAQPSAAC